MLTWVDDRVCTIFTDLNDFSQKKKEYTHNLGECMLNFENVQILSFVFLNLKRDG